MEFIKKHKAQFIVGVVCLILLILAFFAVYRMFYPSSSKSVYGSRLENAPEIDNAVIEKIKNEIIDSDLALEVTYETKVATMKFFIDVKSDTKLEEAKPLSQIILDSLSTKVIDFYDIELFFTVPSGENTNYPLIGYHSKSSTEFSWVDNVAEGDEDEE